MNMERILPPNEKSDMALTSAIPTIISTVDLDAGRRILNEVPMWYSEKTSNYSQVFWTENHYLMYTSAEYVLRRMLGEEIPPALEKRLHVSLDLKLKVGMAEFLSPVYYPLTIASILNLYDYSQCEGIKEKADKILNGITRQLLHFTMPDGSMVSPSGRSYARHRNTSTNQHIHQFIEFVSGRTVNGTSDQALYSTLTTTSWRPQDHVGDNDKETSVILTPALDNLISILDRLVGRGMENLDIYVSILWSYGVYVPPSRALRAMVVSFMDKYDLWSHPHFKSLNGVRKWLCCCASFWVGLVADLPFVSPYVQGLWLVGASATIYREGTVMMSSLTAYNEGLPCFQQWPWMVNLNGVVIWCGFGSTTNSTVFGNADTESSSSKILPIITQRSNYLMAKYNARSRFVQWATRSTRLEMRWPVELFNETLTTPNQWTIGRKNSAVVAYRIQSRMVEVKIMDLDVKGLTLDAFTASLLE